MTLRKGENVLSFPEGPPPDIDLSKFAGLKAKPYEYWAVLDPPRTKILDGRFELRVAGDGWRDKHTEGLEEAERSYRAAEAEALERIALHEKDPRSSRAYKLAHMAAEIAMAAHARWQAMLEPEAPGSGLEMRPDSYTVVSAGDKVPLERGDRVIVAPYAARRIKRLFETDDVCLIGLEDDWEEITPFVLNLDSGYFEPMSNWVVLSMWFHRGTLERTRKKFINAAVVVDRGPAAYFNRGDVVITHKDRTIPRPDDTRWFVTKHSHYLKADPHVVVVREHDRQGTRRLLASVETTILAV